MTTSNHLVKLKQTRFMGVSRACLLLVALLLLSGHSAQAQSTWTGATGGDWNTSGNWSGSAVPTSTAVFDTTGTFTVSNSVSVQTVTNIYFDLGAWTIGTTSGHALDLSSGGEILDQDNTVGSNTINAPIVLEGTGGTYTFANNSTPSNDIMVFGGGGITAGGGPGTTTLTLNGTIAKTNANVINGIIGNGSSGATLAINFASPANDATWTLAGQNTFSGGVTMSGAGYLTDTASSTVTSGTNSSGGLGTGTFAVNASGRLVGNGATAITIDNPITFTGSTTLNTQGAFTFGTNSLTTMPTITVSGTQGITDLTYQDIINDAIVGTTGTLTLTGAGGTSSTALILNGSNTFSGTISVQTDAVEITNGTAWGDNGPINAVTLGAIMVSGGITGGGSSPNTTTTNKMTLNSLGFVTGATGNLENLSGTNTYNGEVALGKNTTISSDSGTLILNSTVADGAFALTLNGAGAGVINGAITGTTNTSSLTMGGSNSTNSSLWILGGANTYTGATTITTGTLELANSSSLAGTAVTVSSGATLAAVSTTNGPYTIGTGSAGSLTINGGGTLNLEGGGSNQLALLNTGSTALTLGTTGTNSTITLEFDVTGSTADELKLQNSSSAVSMSNTTVDVDINSLGGLTGGTETLISAPGGGLETATNDYILAVTGTTNGYTLVLDPTSTALILEETISASAPAVAYWTGTNSASWTVAGNFSTTNTSNVPATSVPGSATDVVFGTSSPTPTNLNTTLDAPTTINSLTFATSSNVSIAPGASATNTLTLEAATTTSSNGINVAPNGIKVNSGAGTVAISASVVLGTNQTWTNSSTHTLTVSGNVSGGFGLTTAGSGTIALTTNNNYTGGTTITAGVLAINSVAASGSAQSLGTGSNLTLSGVSSTSNATLDYTGGTATFGQNITVSNGDYGTVENGGSGVLNLSGSISKNGSVLTLSGGKFVVSGVISGTSNNSDLDLNATTVALSNTNSYNGPTSIANGSYLLTAVNNALPTPTNTAVTFGLPTDSGVTNTLDLMGNNETVASLNVGSTNSNVVSQVISSASTVNGSNITISGSPSGTVGTLTVATTTNDTFSGSLGGSGSATNFNLVKSGTGTLVLSGTNTYTGSTTITGGGIDVTGSTLSTAIGVGNGGTLSGTGFVGAITVNSGGILSPGAAPYNLQPKLSASSNNVLTGTSLTVHGGSILSYNLYNATGNTGTALSPAGGTVVNLGLGAFDLAGDVTSGAPVIINLNNTASAGFGTITDGIPNVYNLVEFGSGDTNITLADLTNGDFDITNLSSVLNPANSAYLTLTNLGDGQEALQLDVVPEPGTWALFGLGLGFLFLVVRRRKTS